MRKIFLLALMCLQATIVSADVVKGRVVDADSGEPIEGASVRVGVDQIGQYYYQAWLQTDSVGTFSWSVRNMSKVDIEVTYFGYNPTKKAFNCSGGTRDTLNLGDLKLKMSDALMKEVMVEAKAKRFYMKGDTVVFNPEAFNLDDGDRVATLLKKLPGVSIDGGKLLFNGKEVHLKMNGKDVADDFLTGQLPAEAVQNIKAYDKKSELAELTGMDDGQEQQVIDITIKPGFMDKWYGQTKATAYASKNYRASANMHYLTDKDPINFYVRASDCGSQTYGVWGDNDYDWESAVPQRQQMGQFSYQYNWKPSYVTTSYNDNFRVKTNPDHNDSHQNSWTKTETYLSSGSNGSSESSNSSGSSTSTLNDSHSHYYDHSFEVPLSFDTYLHLKPKTTLWITGNGSFDRTDSRNSSEQNTRTMEGEDVNSSTSRSTRHKDSGNFHSYARLGHVMKRADFYMSDQIYMNKGKGRSDSKSDYTYNELGTSEQLLRSTDERNYSFQNIFDTKISMQLVEKKLKMGIGYWLDYKLTSDDIDATKNGAKDWTNSYDRTKYYIVNEPRVELEADLGKVWMRAAVKMQNADEHLDYKRGEPGSENRLDTVMHHNTWFPRPSFEMRWTTSKNTELKAGANWDYRVADMLQSAAYIDNSNPLAITMGNPNLKPSSTFNANLLYNMMFTKASQIMSLSLTYRHEFDPNGGVGLYNAKTGGMISSTTNVDDSQSMTASLSYDCALGPYFRLTNRIGYAYGQQYGIKTLTIDEMPAVLTPGILPIDDVAKRANMYCKKANNVDESLSVTFENKGWEVTAYGEFSYDALMYSDKTIDGQNLWHYDTGVRGEYKLKDWKFNMQGHVVGDAGYMSDYMNRNRFALDASITWKCIKGRGQLTLMAKDLLNQMEDTSFNISPTMRSETHTETFHRYVSLGFQYNFDAKAKKKDKK